MKRHIEPFGSPIWERYQGNHIDYGRNGDILKNSFGGHKQFENIGNLKNTNSGCWPIFVEFEDRWILYIDGWNNDGRLLINEYEHDYDNFYEDYIDSMYKGLGRATQWEGAGGIVNELFKDIEDIYSKKVKDIYFNDDSSYDGITFSQLNELMRLVLMEIMGKKYNI